MKEIVYFPNSVNSIGNCAFMCTDLTTLNIPNSITNIGIAAFQNCDDLETITIGKGVTNIQKNAFEGCYKLHDIYYTGTEEEWNSITIDPNNSELNNIHYSTSALTTE